MNSILNIDRPIHSNQVPDEVPEEVNQLRAPTFFSVLSATPRWQNKFNPFVRRLTDSRPTDDERVNVDPVSTVPSSEFHQLRDPTFFNVLSATNRWPNQFNSFARR